MLLRENRGTTFGVGFNKVMSFLSNFFGFLKGGVGTKCRDLNLLKSKILLKLAVGV